MRTKALLLGAMLGAASLVTSMAQVYSVNIVGYVNVSIPTGWSIIQNPLNASPNNQAINVVPYGSSDKIFAVYKWSSTLGRYLVNAFDGTAPLWDDETMELNPGEGFFVYNSATPFTLTFVGEVPTGNLSTPLYTGWNMIGSKVPQQGLLQDELGYVPAAPAEMVYRWSNSLNRYVIYSWDTDLLWDPDGNGQPTLGVAEAAWIFRTAGTGAWTRTFNVN